MKTILSGILILILAVNVFAQHVKSLPDSTGRPRNSVFLSLGVLGEHTSTTLHYERLIPIVPGIIIASGIGFGTEREWDINFESTSISEPYGNLPLHASLLIGGKNLFAEIGLQGTLLSGHNDPNYRIQNVIGLRFQPRRHNRILFRMNFHGFMKGEFCEVISASFGWSF